MLIDLFRDDVSLIQETKDCLQKAFKIKDLGELKYFLGIEFARSKEGILMHQIKYALELVSDMGLAGAKSVGAPMKLNQKLTTTEFDMHVGSYADYVFADPTAYQRLVGRLLFLTITRPNITFTVQCLSHFMHSPKCSHMAAALRIARYIKGSPGLGILMHSETYSQLTTYYDIYWLHCDAS
ncbi:uncharacterized mitochondrial protein AtMg00810-like [Nicotiana tomentosiformis]|uniref:uncharacterized mitochondrial protein AtMg00810-like n=1 Tax=Nicotiana tomentosiformis TaxID=4098 RepID=UPI00388C4C6D